METELYGIDTVDNDELSRHILDMNHKTVEDLKEQTLSRDLVAIGNKLFKAVINISLN